MASRYRIIDEPAPGILARLAVRPLWPLLAFMAAGPWLAWPWAVLNAHAVGSPSRWRQTLLAVGGFIGTALLLVAIIAFDNVGLIEGDMQARLALLLLVVWKLGVTYWLVTLQAPAVELFEYYRGTVRNAFPVLLAAFFLGPKLMALLPWKIRLIVGLG